MSGERAPFVVTFTGITGQVREHYKAALTRLGAQYSGALQPGLTTHLVCWTDDPEQRVASAKYRLAAAAGIPLLSSDWLDDSAAQGFLLAPERYLLSLGSPSAQQRDRPCTSHSVSALHVPSVEKLRHHGRVSPGEFLVPRLLAGAEASPAPGLGQLSVHANNEEAPALCRETSHGLLASPIPGHMALGSPWDANLVSSPAGGLVEMDLDLVLLPSCSLAGVELPGSEVVGTLASRRSQNPGEQMLCAIPGHPPGQPCGSSQCQPRPLHEEGGVRHSEAGPAIGTRASAEASRNTSAASLGRPPLAPLQSSDVGGAGGEQSAAQNAGAGLSWGGAAAASCMPAETPGAAGSSKATSGKCSGSGGSTDSDTRVERLVASMAQLAAHNVTVRRRFRPYRQVWSAPRPAGGDVSFGAQVGGAPAGVQELCSSSSGDSGMPLRSIPGGGSEAAAAVPTQGEPPAAPSCYLISVGYSPPLVPGTGSEVPTWAGPSCGEAPAQPSGPRSDRPGLASYVPTTRVVLGRRVAPPPCSSSAVLGLLGHHGLASAQGVQFYGSARLHLADGRMLTFQTGDAMHGAKMVYDMGPGGELAHAQALVLSIYTLPGSGEAYFEHKYFLSAADLEQRPGWRGFLKEAVVRPEELLLTLGSYHSPLHLVVGEFGVAYTGHAQPKPDVLQAPRQAYLPLLECRRGFDTARGKGVPLRRALSEVH